MTEPLVRVEGLKKFFPIKGGFFRRTVAHVKAVDSVSFEVHPGKTLGVVGESGCGKSTLGRALLRLQEATDGRVLYKGVDICGLEAKELVPMRKHMQIIFQDPFASLNPRSTVFEIIEEPLVTHKIGTPKERFDKVVKLMELVGLRSQVMHRYPHEFSGGQRQRIGIARALALEPSFIVADEPVSALDVSVQSQVLNLIKDLQKNLGIAFMFISHDLAVVQHISHQVAVMYLGKIVEKAPTAQLFKNPKHPYTRALLSAIPKPDPEAKNERIILEGDVPSPISPPSGCPFHTRCREAREDCKTRVPKLTAHRDDDSSGKGDGESLHYVSCLLYEK